MHAGNFTVTEQFYAVKSLADSFTSVPFRGKLLFSEVKENRDNHCRLAGICRIFCLFALTCIWRRLTTRHYAVKGISSAVPPYCRKVTFFKYSKVSASHHCWPSRIWCCEAKAKRFHTSMF